MTRTDIMQKIIEKHEKYLKWLKDYYMLNLHNDFESELADLKRQLTEWTELDKGWKELENSGLDKPIVFPNRPNPIDVNPYDSKAIKRTRKPKIL